MYLDFTICVCFRIVWVTGAQIADPIRWFNYYGNYVIWKNAVRHDFVCTVTKPSYNREHLYLKGSYIQVEIVLEDSDVVSYLSFVHHLFTWQPGLIQLFTGLSIAFLYHCKKPTRSTILLKPSTLVVVNEYLINLMRYDR